MGKAQPTYPEDLTRRPSLRPAPTSDPAGGSAAQSAGLDYFHSMK